MSFKIAHKNKVQAKKLGSTFNRKALTVTGDSFFKKPSRLGKNRINTEVIGVASKSGSGDSILEKLAKQDAEDGGNRVEQILSGS
ncbi:hypothetical protein [Vibrio fluvialis]|uniref:hypothetical protein n=1 Tax=Vibrio fluvialis TaxID=676 RepID=UPI001302AAB1|nr:hypothetical protein [Vibrio fluvialis]